MDNKEELELTQPEDTVEEAAENTAEELNEVAAEAESEAEEALEADTAEADNIEGAVEESHPEQEAPKKKKGPFIQVPVIIALCIVVLTLLGYFTYTSFFLREPEGVTWEKEYDGITYYFDFNDNGEFKSYVGSVELTGTYEKLSDENGKYLIVNADAGDFYSGEKAEFTVTGSRLLGDQKLTIKYGEDYEATFDQSKGRVDPLELPEDFEPDEELVGSWSFSFYGYEYCTVDFNADGSLSLRYNQNGVTYNGTYTIDNGSINFTYYVGESIVQPIEYSVDGDVLTFMGMQFTRVGSDATVDEMLYM